MELKKKPIQNLKFDGNWLAIFGKNKDNGKSEIEISKIDIDTGYLYLE